MDVVEITGALPENVNHQNDEKAIDATKYMEILFSENDSLLRRLA